MKLKIKKIFIIIYWKVVFKIMQLLPLKRTILFESFLGRSASGNTKALFDYMNDNDYSYNYVWSLKDEKEVIVGSKVVKRMSIKYLYYIATSKYIVNNSRMPLKWEKRKGQVYIQTWHGTPLKRLVYDMDNVTLPDTNKESYLKNFSFDVSKWDYLIAANDFSKDKFRSAFRYEGKILNYGYPRNEVLLKDNSNRIVEIKKELGIDLDTKVILYAPTFRDNSYIQKGKYIQDIMFDPKKLLEKFDEKVVIILKCHYLIYEIKYHYSDENIINLTEYKDINDLYLITDLLITDYSSVFFDYMLLEKPVLFYQYDQAEYKDDIRGFYIPLEDLPGKIAVTEEQLYDKVSFEYDRNKVNISNEKYNFLEKHENCSQKIIEKVLGEE